jgi:hypothetical protein
MGFGGVGGGGGPEEWRLRTASCSRHSPGPGAPREVRRSGSTAPPAPVLRNQRTGI